MNFKIDQVLVTIESLRNTPKELDEMNVKIQETLTLFEKLKNVPEAQNEMNSKIEQIQKEQDGVQSKLNAISASIDVLKNTSKTIVAFRATCAKKFPANTHTFISETPGCNFYYYYYLVPSTSHSNPQFLHALPHKSVL